MTGEREVHLVVFPRGLYVAEPACGNVDRTPKGLLGVLVTGDRTRVTCEVCRESPVFSPEA